MKDNKDFSIIIPVWRGAAHLLPILLSSIPDKEGIEIIIVDNSKEPIKREEIKSSRNITLLHSAPERHAGGSRNDGIAVAKGKWLLFADADDYYASDAFEVFDKQKDSAADIIYFCAEGIYPETGLHSNQADLYTNLVCNYLDHPEQEMPIRLSFHVPWAKMIRRSFVLGHFLRYDEVVANNDDFFALQAGFYASTIAAVKHVVYYYTVTQGSLMRRRNYDVIKARYEVILRCNQFKKQHGLSQYQGSVMYFLSESRHYGIKAMLEFFVMLIKYRQNPFIGMKNWLRTIKKKNEKEQYDAAYIVK